MSRAPQRRAGLPRRGLAAAACAAALALGACGATPPQVPAAQAGKVSDALTAIINACGESYQERAFDPGADLRTLEATATTNAGALAGVFAHHAAWIYQGQTLRQIVTSSIAYLQDCALHQAAAILARETGAPGNAAPAS